MKSFIKHHFWLCLSLATLALIAASFGLGSAQFTLPQMLDLLTGGGSPTERAILFEIRLPRIAMAVIVGASLSMAGACLQGLFRNPLADPYVLGLSSGGSFAAALALLFWPAAQNYPFLVPLSAFTGSALTAFWVYQAAKTPQGLQLNGLLLSGIALGLTFSAALSLVLYFAENRASDLMLWLMGHLNTGLHAVKWVALCLLLGGLVLMAHCDALNALLEGEDSAASLGVDVERVKFRLLAACSLLVAGAVSFCGMIGFVGLLVPHFARIVWGSDLRRLLPISAIGGAFLLLLTDLIARIALPNGELPVGVITGCLGGPFFLWILRRGLRHRD